MSELDRGLRDLVDQAIADSDGPGCVVGVATGPGTIASAWRGLANLEHGVRVGRDTVFHVASLSKQFTAYAVQVLVDAGTIGLDDAVAAHLDWLPREDITVEQLLRHTSGLRDQWQLVEASGRCMEDVITTDEIVDLVRRQRGLNFEPGKRFSYSNTNYTVLGLLVEKCAGASLHEFCDRVIFDPIGMARTRFVADHHEVVRNRADSYEALDGRGYRRLTMSYSTVGATGLNSTVPDLLRWLAHAATPTARRLREPDAPLPEPGPESYGAGVRLGAYGGRRLVYHAGADAGYRCHFMALPDAGAAAVVLANLASLPAEQLCRRALQLAVGPEPTPVARPPKPSVLAGQRTVLTGRYTGRDGDVVELRWLAGDALEVAHRGKITVLERASTNRFGTIAEGSPIIELTTDNRVEFGDEPASAPHQLTRLDGTDQTGLPRHHGRLAGRYFSDEVEAHIRIVETGGELWLHRPRRAPAMLHHVAASTYVAYLPQPAEATSVRLDVGSGGDSLSYSTPLARGISFLRVDGRLG